MVGPGAPPQEVAPAVAAANVLPVKPKLDQRFQAFIHNVLSVRTEGVNALEKIVKYRASSHGMSAEQSNRAYEGVKPEDKAKHQFQAEQQYYTSLGEKIKDSKANKPAAWDMARHQVSQNAERLVMLKEKRDRLLLPAAERAKLPLEQQVVMTPDEQKTFLQDLAQQEAMSVAKIPRLNAKGDMVEMTAAEQADQFTDAARAERFKLAPPDEFKAFAELLPDYDPAKNPLTHIQETVKNMVPGSGKREATIKAINDSNKLSALQKIALNELLAVEQGHGTFAEQRAEIAAKFKGGFLALLMAMYLFSSIAKSREKGGAPQG